jgi:hypothetical protein
MALRCEICGAANPAINRYCGQCGRKLKQSAIDTPEEFCRDTVGESFVPLEVSADLPPEVIEFDNQIPLIADEGSDRRTQATPEMIEQVHDHLEREAELHDQLRHGREIHSQVRAKQQAERDNRDEFLQWNVNPGSNGVHDAASAGAAPPLAQRHSPPEREGPSRTGVSGPSFLGLSDDSVPEDEYEHNEEWGRKSHLRRNVALVIFAAAVVLATLQWRFIRDYGLPYVRNGSMAVKQLAKGDARSSPAVAADNTSRDLGLKPATPKAGTPQAVESSPNAGHALDVQQSAASQPQQPASPSVAASRAASTKRPPAMSAPAVPVADASKQAPTNQATTHDVPPPRSATSASNPTAEPRPVRDAPPPNISRMARSPGADELNRAANARNAEARAAWLWRAVGKGNPQAPVELARMYEQGNGVVRSCDQARVLLRVAAAKGNEEARRNLQLMRIRGGCSGR